MKLQLPTQAHVTQTSCHMHPTHCHHGRRGSHMRLIFNNASGVKNGAPSGANG